MEQKYVDNDLFKYRVSLKCDLDLEDVTVYVKPFPQPWHKDYDPSKEMSLEEKEDLIQEKYFTQEKIDELKQKFVDRIMSEKNPFEISCVDVDSGYNVTEDKLFIF
jgi:hypothetical protein